MLPATLVIRNIGELATCDPGLGDAPGVVRNAAIAATGEVIIFAGPAAELARAAAIGPATVELDAAGGAVVPGFVDAHTHLIWLGDRAQEYELRAQGASYEEIAARGGGIRSTVAATAAGTVDELVAAALPRARRLARCGTTTAEIKSGYGVTLDAEVRQLEAAARLGSEAAVPDILTTYLPLHAAPAGDRGEFVDGVCTEGLARAAARARFVDVFCEQGAFTVAECERVQRAGPRQGLGAKIHAEQRSRSGAVALAARIGAVSADHLEHAADEDLRLMARANVVGVLLPGASLVLDGPPPPGRRLIDAGAVAAIATDCNPGTCYAESMPLMMSLAVATAGITPAEALMAATRGGAAALALTDRGVLRAGSRCDCVVLESPRWLELAYHLGGAGIAQVVRGGALLPTAQP